MPLSSTSSLSTSLRSAVPPPNIFWNVKAKFLRICSKVSENNFWDVALISSISATRAFFDAHRSSVCVFKKSYRSFNSAYSSIATRFTAPIAFMRSRSSLTSSSIGEKSVDSIASKSSWVGSPRSRLGFALISPSSSSSSFTFISNSSSDFHSSDFQSTFAISTSYSLSMRSDMKSNFERIFAMRIWHSFFSEVLRM